MITPYFFDRNCQITAPEILNGFSEGCYLSLFSDDFTDNANGWNLQSKPEFVHAMSGGQLKLNSDENETLTWGMSQDIQGLVGVENWEYTAYFRIASFESGLDDEPNLLLWGSDTGLDNYHAFSFNGKKEFEIYQTSNSASTTHYAGMLASGSFVSGAYTRFTVRTFEGVSYFFLNDDLIFEMPKKDLFGDRIFVGAGPGNEVWVDEIAVSKF